MILTIRLAPAADRLFFGGRDAGDLVEKPEHQQRAIRTDPSVRTSEREEEEEDVKFEDDEDFKDMDLFNDTGFDDEDEDF